MTTLGLPSGKVTGRVVAGVLDTFDLGFEPNNDPLKGTVTFTCSAPNVAVPNGTPAPALVKMLPYVVPLDELGYLTWQGEQYVMLPVPTSETNPSSWVWHVSFQLTYDGERVIYPEFAIAVPEFDPDDAASTTTDLAEAVTVPGLPGEWVSRGPAGDSVKTVTLSPGGDAFVFEIDREGISSFVPVVIPDLAALAGAADTAVAAATTATTKADAATSYAAVAGAAAAVATAKAEEAAGYVGGVADNVISTVKIQNLAVTLPKLATTVQTSLGKADTAVQPAGLTSKADLSGGKLLTSQLPDLAIAEFKGSVATQAAMLALVGERGDWAYRSDLGTNWVVIAEPSSTLANWRALNYPASPVVSVAGKTGAVTLVPADITGTAVITTDTRLTDQRVPTANSVDSSKIVDASIALADMSTAARAESLNYDHTATGTARAAGLGAIGALGFIVPVGFTVTAAYFFFSTADASGNTVITLQKTGNPAGMPTVTITAPAISATATGGPWVFAAGDTITVSITSVGTTPGQGLKVLLVGYLS